MELTTIGLNSYPSTHVRIMFDYPLGRVNGSAHDGDLQIFEARLQCEF